MDIKAIETAYKGYRFRSRLEARWAVFFDEIGMEYEYEPEGVKTKDGAYLPDFYLPKEEIFVEVKGKRDGYMDELDKVLSAVKENNDMVVMILPDIPYSDVDSIWWFKTVLYNRVYKVPVVTKCAFTKEYGIVDYSFTVQDFKIKDISPIEEDFSFKEIPPIRITLDYKFIASALRKARSARFEHGDKPDKEADESRMEKADKLVEFFKQAEEVEKEDDSSKIKMSDMTSEEAFDLLKKAIKEYNPMVYFLVNKATSAKIISDSDHDTLILNFPPEEQNPCFMMKASVNSDMIHRAASNVFKGRVVIICRMIENEEATDADTCD